MNFGEALSSLNSGYKVARGGWNGKNMWLVLVPESIDVPLIPDSPYHKAGLTSVTINSHIDMYTADGTMQPGWLASQSDMLANDWIII